MNVQIGLVRHFKVSRPYLTSQRMTPAEFVRWSTAYDDLPVQPAPIDLGGIDWQICYASNLSRAEKTARQIYDGQIVVTDELREIRIAPVWESQLRLPFYAWEMLARLAWYTQHPSQPETRQACFQRASQLLDKALANGDKHILVVSHGGIMWVLRQELLRRGFRGPRFSVPRNGVLYVFWRR